MSTVLWANLLDGQGVVQSEQADYLALYKHTDKLDDLARKNGLPSFEALCDLTDIKLNMEVIELPEGMTSSDELMAAQGVWMPPAEAERLLQGLIDIIRRDNPRFGLLSNQQADVLQDLEEALAFLRARKPGMRGFNFSVVM